MLQEVAVSLFNFPGYEEMVNVGPRRRGTAMLYRTGLPLQDFTLLPSGRAMSARLHGVTLINVYAPAGTQGRKAREVFFTQEMASLLAAAGGRLIAAGYWNSVLTGADTTRAAYPCNTLKVIIRDMGLVDAWKQLRPGEAGFTYLAPQGACASRLDRIYLTEQLSSTAQHIDILPATMSDHRALIHTASLPAPPPGAPGGGNQGERQWKIDPIILQHEHFTSELRAEWARWRNNKGRFSNVCEWWEDCKRRLRGFCSQYSRTMRSNIKALLQFRTECLMQLYSKERFTEADVELIRRHKRAVNQLLLQSMGGVLERSKCARPCEEEEPSTYHVAAQLKRARTNIINSLHGEDGAVYDTQEALEEHVYRHFESLLSTAKGAAAGPSSFLEDVESVVTAEENGDLLAAITIEELRAALKLSPRRKSPGDDGLTADFYVAAFDVLGEDMLEVFNFMLQSRQVGASHTTGVMVLVPKTAAPREIGNLRPVTLLNADGKVLSRLLAIRLATLEGKLLHPMQCRAGLGRSMHDELMDIRDAISLVNLANQQPGRQRKGKYGACLVSMDFAGAFNHVDHAFMS